MSCIDDYEDKAGKCVAVKSVSKCGNITLLDQSKGTGSSTSELKVEVSNDKGTPKIELTPENTTYSIALSSKSSLHGEQVDSGATQVRTGKWKLS